ncbi:hypothetical protein GCM10009678_51050 [Actinomadura kijaniata]|uniref:Putative MFS family arabinose efflux permease n=1 Tax=Actinomadura namibiensis TaxID=182080 RepID=A0A7W3LI31_ACTNM|nr:MFS transporter [Actinomadura namibiensis]MBA8948525.1 putative MFS family arabinose efflux permease [Actinomadura namibiensis]
MRKVLVLASGTFVLGLDAYVMAGLLGPIAADTGVSVSAAGQMVTAFTLAYAVSTPLFATVLGAARTRTALAASQALLAPLAHLAAPLAALPLVVWGAVGWATQVPQQQRLLDLGGDRRGGVAVAMNNSALYLGGAAGSALGGTALSAGLAADVLPPAAAAVAALGLLLQLLTARAGRASGDARVASGAPLTSCR